MTLDVDGVTVTNTVTPVGHDGPHAQRERAAAREAAQALANKRPSRRDAWGTRALLIAVADAEHTEWPQYKHHWTSTCWASRLATASCTER
jgi:hypothetical protein